MDKKLTHISKFLSLILRHQPEKIGLVLDAQGWADIDSLIELAGRHGKRLDHRLIRRVVELNDKKRFSLSEDGQRIRARQGHSIAVDLGLEARRPPDVLYHGTATRFLEPIQAKGLIKGRRRHVHLSADRDTAVVVGRRHGKPVVLEIDARAMAEQGLLFFLSENGVWLTDHVPPRFFRIEPSS